MKQINVSQKAFTTALVATELSNVLVGKIIVIVRISLLEIYLQVTAYFIKKNIIKNVVIIFSSLVKGL
jgi:hypothetical protein